MKFMLVVLIFSVSTPVLSKNYSFKSRLKAKVKRKHRVITRSLATHNLSKYQCEKIQKSQLYRAKKSIKPFTVGKRKIGNMDLNGDFTPLEKSFDFGHYAKLGLSDDHTYQVKKMNTQYAIHADPRCAKYAKVTKVDRSIYKGKSCRRIHIALGKVKYKTLFCQGDKKGYVDHFYLTKAI